MSRLVRALFLVALALLSGCGSADKDGRAVFKHWIIDPKPNTGIECCTDVLMIGDINRDGAQDVVIGAQNAAGIGLVWYQYPTWKKHPVARGEFTTDGQLADIDGDGDLDIVIGEFPGGKGRVVWFENRLGSEPQWIRHEIGIGYAHDLVVGDVNGDGKLDLVTCDKKEVVLWIQVTGDRFRKHVLLRRRGEGIALADIDRDGDLDIVAGGSWLENPGFHDAMGVWKRRPIAPHWHRNTRVAVADMNHDGRADVILSVSEGKGPLSWFEAPMDPRSGAWVEHPVEKGLLEGAHSLQVADFNGDGRLDVLTAEMHTSSRKRVLVYYNKGNGFAPAVLSRNGSHNMRIADIDGDGDFDIVGKNYAGAGRVVEWWENRTSGVDNWKYISIDSNRPRRQWRKMGLAFTDANRDGYLDVIAGAFLYTNPGGNLQNVWRKELILDQRMDVYFAVDVDGDASADLIGIMGFVKL